MYHRLSFPLLLLLLLLGACASLVAAASAPTFCKCTCFTNSTIIEIKSTSKVPGAVTPPVHLAEPETVDDASAIDTLPDLNAATSLFDEDPAEDLLIPDTTSSRSRSRHRRGIKRAQPSPSCNQCNRAFCLAQSLPICKGAAEKDVVTMCFQRDSRKDQIIVWGFLLGTAGLLAWAAARKTWAMKQQGGGLSAMLRGDGGGGGGRSAGVAVPVGRAAGGFVGSSGRDLGRGQYATVAGHSREGSEVLT